MPQKREQDVELAETFAEVARALLEEHDVGPSLDRICELAVKTVEGCEAAGISIAEGKKVSSRSTTNDLPGIVDEIQSDTQQGPCVDAIKEHEVFLTGSLSQESSTPASCPPPATWRTPSTPRRPTATRSPTRPRPT